MPEKRNAYVVASDKSLVVHLGEVTEETGQYLIVREPQAGHNELTCHDYKMFKDLLTRRGAIIEIGPQKVYPTRNTNDELDRFVEFAREKSEIKPG